MQPRILSLFSGYGGLDIAVQEVFGGELVAVADIDSGPCKILAHRHPGVPNLGDVSTIDWTTIHADIICGGSPCFAAGTPVLTRRGLVPIEAVAIGDEVWTNKARWRRVSATMSRMSETIEFRPGFFCTPEHMFWLRPTSKVWVQSDRSYRRSVGEVRWVEAQHSTGHYAATPVSIAEVKHSKPAGIDWWQVGRYLADGYTNHQVNVYIGKGKEGDIARFPGWSKHQQETAMKLTMPKSKHVAGWLNDNFGKGAAGKTVPAFVLALPEDSRREVLDGYWSGDGYSFAKRSMRSASVSPMLTIGISMLAASLGYSISLHHNETAPTTTIQGRTVNQRDWWSVTATPDEGRYTERDSDWMWHKLRKQPKPGPVQAVYDITVEDDHSFVAAGIVVHNCQDLSTAGRRAGMTDGTRSNLWVMMREGIAQLRPRYVIWENVRGAYSASAASAMESNPRLLGDHPAGVPALRALGRVLGDLADLGYDAQWCGLPASGVGAPHGRFRVFLLATDSRGDGGHEGDVAIVGRTRDAGATGLPAERHRLATANADQPRLEGQQDQAGAAQAGRHGHALAGADGPDLTLLPTPRSSDTNGAGAHGQGGPDLRSAIDLLHTPRATNMENRQSEQFRGADGNFYGLLNGLTDWGKYADAIARWEAIHGPAPAPTMTSQRSGNQQLSPAFTEWMMGLPAGWITDVPGITRNEALKACGNGVVPQQAIAALRHMLAQQEVAA